MERTGAASSANDVQPQDHDRILTQRYDGAVYTKPAVTDVEEEEIEPEITIGQKMLSAVSGSVLTSLLGMVNKLQHLHSLRCNQLILFFQSHHLMSSAYDYNHNNRQHPQQHLDQIPPFHILVPSQTSHQNSASHLAAKKSSG